MFRYHRHRLGWTQEDLADLVNKTPRLIAKAEAGGCLHPDSIEAIAAALTTPEIHVFPDELVSSPKQLARAIVEGYARHERQCTKHLHHLLADDIVVVAPGPQDVFTFCGEHHTKDGFDRFWGKFFGMMERLDKQRIVDSMRIIAEGNEVVVLTSEYASAKGDPAPPNVTPIAFVMEFEAGKLRRFEDHFDPTAGYEKLRKMRGLG
ncbi:nuclear transport factor 2 family protein [Botrimarina mediterranea]|uniref:HTH cro/C1-type domain-containing protein n=1 Tax=Botrimarina mediterranea TaxID=2528022 RepID=A0A518K5Z7_9BACT|nr:nuclear transport factor 2 family protein [Botrimarina mediterranea]QDV73209.1 hypothetical protein Spa11_14050 [Botrimarina mediterranea]